MFAFKLELFVRASDLRASEEGSRARLVLESCGSAPEVPLRMLPSESASELRARVVERVRQPGIARARTCERKRDREKRGKRDREKRERETEAERERERKECPGEREGEMPCLESWLESKRAVRPANVASSLLVSAHAGLYT